MKYFESMLQPGFETGGSNPGHVSDGNVICRWFQGTYDDDGDGDDGDDDDDEKDVEKMTRKMMMVMMVMTLLMVSDDGDEDVDFGFSDWNVICK